MPLFSNWDFQGFGMAVVAAGVFGGLGIVLLALGFKVFEKITPKLDLEKELAEKNVAVGIVVGAMILALGLVIYAAIHP